MRFSNVNHNMHHNPFVSCSHKVPDVESLSVCQFLFDQYVVCSCSHSPPSTGYLSPGVTVCYFVLSVQFPIMSERQYISLLLHCNSQLRNMYHISFDTQKQGMAITHSCCSLVRCVPFHMRIHRVHVVNVCIQCASQPHPYSPIGPLLQLLMLHIITGGKAIMCILVLFN